MNSDEYEPTWEQLKRRQMTPERLNADRQQALRQVNEIFDERAQLAATLVEMDQVTAQRLFAMVLRLAHSTAGYDTVSLAFRHDQPESRDALKMFLQTFNRGLPMFDRPGAIGHATVKHWLYGLDLLSHGIELPVFETAKIPGGKTKQKTDIRNRLLILWYSYLCELHGHGSSVSNIKTLSKYFGKKEKTIEKIVASARDYELEVKIEFYQYLAREMKWPSGLTGSENLKIRAAFRALKSEPLAVWASGGDDWDMASHIRESLAKRRAMLVAALDEHLEGHWENP